MASDLSTTPTSDLPITAQQYGVGARFTLAVYDSDFERIIIDALDSAGTDGLTISTNDISTLVTGTEQRIVEYLCQVISAAAATGVHISAAILLSRGCPGELECALPPGVSAIGAAPVQLAPTGQTARAHWSLYPLLDSRPVQPAAPAEVVDHMTPIYQAIEQVKHAGLYSGSDSYATRLEGDLGQLLEACANAWLNVGATVQHVVSHLSVSMNSPTPTTL